VQDCCTEQLLWVQQLFFFSDYLVAFFE